MPVLASGRRPLVTRIAPPRSAKALPERGRLLPRSSEKSCKAKFAFWAFSEVGQEFIGNSSPLASVAVSADLGGVITPPLGKGGANEAHPGVVDGGVGAGSDSSG